MSASLSWRKTWPAAWAISVCMASSFSSFLPSVCGLYRSSAFQQQPVGRQHVGGEELLHAGGGNGQDFRADVAGRLGRAAGDVDEPALHPLVAAVGRVFGRSQMGVSPQPFAGAIEILVELQARGQRLASVPRLPWNSA